jgi:hypothetical protein
MGSSPFSRPSRAISSASRMNRPLSDVTSYLQPRSCRTGETKI